MGDGVCWRRSACGHGYLDLFPGAQFTALYVCVCSAFVIPSLLILGGMVGTSWASNNLRALSSFICQRLLIDSFISFPQFQVVPLVVIFNRQKTSFTTTNSNSEQTNIKALFITSSDHLYAPCRLPGIKKLCGLRFPIFDWGGPINCSLCLVCSWSFLWWLGSSCWLRLRQGWLLIAACCWLEELITDIANAMNNYYKLMKIIVFLAN